jgi:hypothetical protein
MLVPPVGPTCISSQFGPRVLANHPQAGTYHRGVDLPAPPGASIVGAAPRQGLRIQKKGPGGLEILVQHDGFVAIYRSGKSINDIFAFRDRLMDIITGRVRHLVTSHDVSARVPRLRQETH